VIKRKTAKDRLKRALKALSEWCRKNRHRPIKEQHQTLKQKVHPRKKGDIALLRVNRALCSPLFPVNKALCPALFVPILPETSRIGPELRFGQVPLRAWCESAHRRMSGLLSFRRP
jgi:hypothetical protein